MDVQQALMQPPVGQGPPQPNGGALPSQAAPGGLPPATDALDYGYAALVTGLKKLAQQLTMANRQIQGNEVDAMANKLNKMRLKDKTEFAQTQALLQGAQLTSQI